ncbi:MAG: hypothetical protein QXN90_03255 [Zestosphaera sp.]
MNNRRKPKFSALISLDEVEAYEGYLVTWLADVATTYLINLRLSGTLVKEKSGLLCKEADEYVTELKKKNPNICESVPLPLPPNDTSEHYNLCKAVEMICDYNRGKVETYALPPALSLEFTEYVRAFMSREKLKRDVVGVESILHGLAVIGAHISYAYYDRQRGERGYVFIDVPNPEAIEYRKLSGMAVRVTRSVNDNEGTKLSLLVGVASAIALTYGATLKEVTSKSPLKADFVRLVKTGNKVMLKAFETLDLSNLARHIQRLGIASPIYSLTSNYPPSEKHVLRSFVQRLSKAIVICESLNDYTEIYSTLRLITSENFLRELKSYYENWREIIDNLLEIRVS